MLVHRPSHYRDPGTWRSRLTLAELEQFLRRITPALSEFNALAAREAVRNSTPRLPQGEPAAGRKIVHTVEDAAIVYFELDVTSYRPSPGAARIDLPSPVRVAYEGLAEFGAHHPELESLQVLIAAEQTVRELAQRDDLVPHAGASR